MKKRPEALLPAVSLCLVLHEANQNIKKVDFSSPQTALLLYL